MSGTGVLPDGSPRRRWSQMTLADSGILILGFALAFAVIRPFVAAPGIGTLGLVASQIATMAVRCALATTVLALIHQVRRRGYPRPAEWLALALVLSWPDGPVRDLYDRFYLGLYWLASHPIEIGPIIYAPRETTISLFLAVVGCLGFAAIRSAIPPRARTPIILILAILLVWGALPSLLVEASQALGASSMSWPGWLRQAAATSGFILTRLVFASVPALPATATVRDFLRCDRPPWSASEGLGAAAGLAMALAWVLSEVATIVSLASMPIVLLRRELLDLPATAAAYGLGWIVIRRYGPDWNRWLTAG